MPVVLAAGVCSALRGEWWWLAYALFLTVNGAYNLRVYRTLAQQASEGAAEDPQG